LRLDIHATLDSFVKVVMKSTITHSLRWHGFTAALLFVPILATAPLRADTLTASDGAESDYFGYSVSLSGDNALVGAYRNAVNGAVSGSAYYFKDLGSNTTGAATQSVKLTASDGADYDRFGSSVSLSGDNALVGAYWNDDKVTDSGSAYYFKDLDSNTTGAATQSVKLTASDGAESDYFGGSVSLSGDNALVGAYGNAVNGAVSGSAYYFKDLDSITPKH
jgi:hypothetical protein